MNVFAEFLSSRLSFVRSGFALRQGHKALIAGDSEGAVKYFTEALQAKTDVLKTKRHPTVAKTMAHLAAAHRMRGDEATAAKLLEESIEILQEKAPNDEDIPINMNNFAVALRNSGKVVS